MDKKKILIIAHGHPDVHKGGAEIAAYQLFNEYETLGHDVTFLARSEEAPHGGAAFSVRNKGLFRADLVDSLFIDRCHRSHLP